MPVQIEAYKPRATPVDTVGKARAFQESANPARLAYDAPPDAGGGLMGLVDALKSVHAPLQEAAQTYMKQVSEEDILAGKQEAIKSLTTWGEAVKNGTVPPDASPWFMKGYKEQKGRIEGRNIYADALTAYESSPVPNSDDPKALNNFIQANIAARLDGITDPDVLRGLQPQIEQATNQLVNHHIAERSKAVAEAAEMQTGAEIGQLADKHRSAEGGLNVAALHADLRLIERRQIALGMSPAKINKLMIDTVVEKAKQTGDVALLDVLSIPRTEGGKDAPGFTTYGLQKTDAAAQAIWSMRTQLDDHKVKLENRETKKKADQSMREGLELLSVNPSVPLSEPFLKEGSKYDPDFRIKMNTARGALIAGKRQGHDNDVAALDKKLYFGDGTVDDIVTAVRNGWLDDGEARIRMDNLARKDRYATSHSNHLRVLGIEVGGIDSLINQGSHAVLKNFGAVDGLKSTLYVEAFSWFDKNPKGSVGEFQTHIKKIKKDSLDSILAEDLAPAPPAADPKAKKPAAAAPKKIAPPKAPPKDGNAFGRFYQGPVIDSPVSP